MQIKKLQPPKIGGYADVSLLDTGVYLEVPARQQGRHRRGRPAQLHRRASSTPPSPTTPRSTSSRRPRYYDYQLLANYRPAPAHDLRAFFFGSDDRLEILFRNPADIDTTLQRQLVLGLAPTSTGRC